MKGLGDRPLFHGLPLCRSYLAVGRERVGRVTTPGPFLRSGVMPSRRVVVMSETLGARPFRREPGGIGTRGDRGQQTAELGAQIFLEQFAVTGEALLDGEAAGIAPGEHLEALQQIVLVVRFGPVALNLPKGVQLIGQDRCNGHPNSPWDVLRDGGCGGGHELVVGWVRG